MTQHVDHPVIVITGASSGIGRDVATTLSARGEAVLVLVGRDADRLASVASECIGGETVCIAADLGAPGEAQRVTDEVLGRFGRLDTLVASAGLYLGAEVHESAADAVTALLQVNVTGTIQLVHAALPAMRRAGRGDIMLVTSVSGYQDIHWEPVYSASKHAIVSFTHTLRRQLVGTGLRVMSVGPGVVLTELWGYDRGDDRIPDEAVTGRGIEVSHVTNAICFMLDQPPHVTIRDLVILPTNQEI